MPNRTAGLTERTAQLQRLAEAAGREPIPVALSGVEPDPEPIERAREAGIHRCAFYIQPADAGDTERQLEKLTSRLGLA
jgi:hypothetical protein